MKGEVMSDLAQQELIRIRRAAEDAAYAMNRNYKPFIDVVSHPLNIIALVDMAQKSIKQQSKVDELQKQLIDQGQRFNDQSQRVKDLEHKSGELQKRVDASSKVLESIRKEIKHGHLSDDESQTLSSYANDLEQALKGEKQ
ncbi:hypothetical protein [Acinetobacter beijerinckii]|uniref:hypothetical protein n=1 Tax=Acinetobacter beijerinckii TaxID=262668 RepID=UPI0030DDA764